MFRVYYFNECIERRITNVRQLCTDCQRMKRWTTTVREHVTYRLDDGTIKEFRSQTLITNVTELTYEVETNPLFLL